MKSKFFVIVTFLIGLIIGFGINKIPMSKSADNTSVSAVSADSTRSTETKKIVRVSDIPKIGHQMLMLKKGKLPFQLRADSPSLKNIKMMMSEYAYIHFIIKSDGKIDLKGISVTRCNLTKQREVKKLLSKWRYIGNNKKRIQQVAFIYLPNAVDKKNTFTMDSEKTNLPLGILFENLVR